MTAAHDWGAQFESQCGVSIETLLGPISEQSPSGVDLRSDPLYRQIRLARESDDPTLPQGPWECVLKRADWDKVKALTLETLAFRSKDLQLCFWLLEAQIHLCGFAGIAPLVFLIRELCDRHWECLYPSAAGDSHEFRKNLFFAAGKTLAPTARVMPLFHGTRDNITWADCIRAQRNQQLIASGTKSSDVDGPTIADCRKVLMATTDLQLAALAQTTGDALLGIAALSEVLSRKCPDEPPTLGPFATVLHEIHEFAATELTQRGYEVHTTREEEPTEWSEGSFEPSLMDAADEPARCNQAALASPPQLDILQQRALAYARLDEIARLLERLDPHSPSPYLIRRAVAWGSLGTAQLYQELFVRCQGQLNIFEMMGIAPPK